MALRSALGAPRSRLIRQGLAQTLLLSILGTAGGLLIASWLTPALVALSPEGADATGSAIREFDFGVRIDWPVFTFAAVVMLLIGLGFGLLPAWRGSLADLRGAVNSVGRGATFDRGTRRILSILIVAEIAIAADVTHGTIRAISNRLALRASAWPAESDQPGEEQGQHEETGAEATVVEEGL